MINADTSPTSTAPDTDDFFAAIRIDQSYASDAVSVAKPLLTVPVRKPAKGEFFRTSRTQYQDCLVLERKEERETYLVFNNLHGVLAEFVEPVRLRLCVNRQGTVLLWPQKLPRVDLRGDTWRRSAAEAATLAESKWVRVAADMNLGAYQPYVATADLGEPQWPKETLEAIVKVGFKGMIIDRIEHPVVQQLLGQA